MFPSPPTPSTSPELPVLSFEDLERAAEVQARWLWHGYLAPGNVTLLTSQWKAGKTTLLAALLDRMKTGGDLGGRTVTAARAVVVSEEGPEHWVRRGRKFDLAGHVGWLCRPFPAKPTPAQWLALLDRLARLRNEHAIDLAVIDPLASFLPGRDENSAAGMLEALLPLQRLTGAGMAVLVLHHPRKQAGGEGLAARGSGALSGYVDVLIEMGWFGVPSEGDRRRRLRGWSRHEETPRQLVLELDADGRTYRACGDFAAAEEMDRQQVVMAILASASEAGYTRQELLDRWPGTRGPDQATLWRWLERAVAAGRVWRTGTGRRSSPYRYGLPGNGPPRPFLPDLPDLPPLEPLG